MTAIVRTMYGIKIGQREVDGYVNATAMCQACNKHLAHYLENKNVKAFLEALSRSIGIPIDLLVVKITKGKNETRGTWVHPQVAINLGQWCSPEFAVAVSSWIFEWMQTGAIKQQLQVARLEGKATRRQLTDAIADYLTRHPEVSDNHRKWMYSNASDAVNLVVFKKSSHRLCADLSVNNDIVLLLSQSQDRSVSPLPAAIPTGLFARKSWQMSTCPIITRKRSVQLSISVISL